MDVDLSLVIVLVVGALSGLLAQALRLPKVLGMIFAGVVLAPALSLGVTTACKDPSNPTSPASTMRTMALLLALARGAFGLDFSVVANVKLTVGMLAVAPFFVELLVEAAVAWAVLPASSGIGGTSPIRVAFLAAALWASLSPSLVIPNMLTIIDDEKSTSPAPHVILCAAPLEVAAALVAYGAMESGVESVVAGESSLSLLLVPIWLVLSVVLGVALAFALRAWRLVRDHEVVVKVIGKALPAEQLLTLLAIYLFAYSVCTPYYAKNLTAVVAALACVLGVRVLSPELAEMAGPQLKVGWAFAEVLLFVMTGVVVRGAIDSRSEAFSGGFFAVLLLGNLSRLVVDVFVAVVWHGQVQRAAATLLSPAEFKDESRASLLADESDVAADNADEPKREWWRDVAARAAFMWATTTPKATVQAALGGAPAASYIALGITQATGAFIQQSSAISILYCATIGSLLTHSLGRYLLKTALAAPRKTEAVPVKAAIEFISQPPTEIVSGTH